MDGNACYYFRDWKRIGGVHEEIYGNVTGISGDVSGIYGDVTGISGDVSGIYGDATGISGRVSGIYGDATGIIGDIDDCKLTKEEREAGVNIEDLVAVG